MGGICVTIQRRKKGTRGREEVKLREGGVWRWEDKYSDKGKSGVRRGRVEWGGKELWEKRQLPEQSSGNRHNKEHDNDDAVTKFTNNKQSPSRTLWECVCGGRMSKPQHNTTNIMKYTQTPTLCGLKIVRCRQLMNSVDIAIKNYDTWYDFITFFMTFYDPVDTL